MASKIKGIMIKHGLNDYEYWKPKLTSEDEATIYKILKKYETTNGQFDNSLRGNLQIVDVD